MTTELIWKDLEEICKCGHRYGVHYGISPGKLGPNCSGCPPDPEGLIRSPNCPGFQKQIPNPIPETPISEEKKSMSTSIKSVTKNYKLPDGREYLTRSLGGFDNDVEGIQEIARMGKHFMLLGDPGCGKTALIQAAFPNAENEIGHSKLTAWDMLWRVRMKEDGTVAYDPAPLVRAAMKGVPLYVDETMRLSEDAFTPLFSAMDGRGFIVGGNHDGTDLPIKKGFLVIGASNPLVRGAFLPDAIASRFHILNVETSADLLERMGLDERLLTIWKNLSTLDGGETWRPSIRELRSAQEFLSAGNQAQAAYAMSGWRIPARDRATVAGVISPILGVRVGDNGGTIR